MNTQTELYKQLIREILESEAKPVNPTRLRNLAQKRLGERFNYGTMEYTSWHEAVDHMINSRELSKYQESRGSHKKLYFSDAPVVHGYIRA